MVSDGFTPPVVGNSEPSQIQRFGMSQLRPSALTTLVLRVRAHAAGAHQMAGVVVGPQVAPARRLQHLAHEPHRMALQPLVVVRVGERDARNAQSVLVEFRRRARRGSAARGSVSATGTKPAV